MFESDGRNVSVVTDKLTQTVNITPLGQRVSRESSVFFVRIRPPIKNLGDKLRNKGFRTVDELLDHVTNLRGSQVEKNDLGWVPNPKDPLWKKWLKRIQEHPVIAALSLIGAIVIALAPFVRAVREILDAWKG